jgi:hypothetical protein
LAAYLGGGAGNARLIAARMFQVCEDFTAVMPPQLSATERKAYELFLEGLTAAEISAVLSMSVQSVIETLEKVKDSGLEVDLRLLIDSRTFSRVKAELERTKDVAAAHGIVGDCELAEVALVAKLTGAGI